MSKKIHPAPKRDVYIKTIEEAFEPNRRYTVLEAAALTGLSKDQVRDALDHMAGNGVALKRKGKNCVEFSVLDDSHDAPFRRPVTVVTVQRSDAWLFGDYRPAA